MIHCAVQTATSPSPQPIDNTIDLKRLYPDRFEGNGDFKGELHLNLQENAQPVVQPPSKYPIQLLDKKGGKSSSQHSIMEPTDWANALVFIRIPQWGAADAEIKVPSGENTELKRSPF